MAKREGFFSYIQACSSFIWPFESEKCGKEGKKLQKFEYLENGKSFLDEIKKHFSLFSKWFLLVKYKNRTNSES